MHIKIAHLSLPLHGVDENDALRQAFVRDQDLVQLVIHWLPGNLWDQWEAESEGKTDPHLDTVTAVCGEQLRVRCYICVLFTCAMSRESGEHSLSMLLVLSLWALEFCRSFMEVLRGRLCSLFSILLKKRQKKKKAAQNMWQTLKQLSYRLDHKTQSCVRVSRCAVLLRTSETYGSGIPFCRACQQ